MIHTRSEYFRVFRHQNGKSGAGPPDAHNYHCCMCPGSLEATGMNTMIRDDFSRSSYYICSTCGELYILSFHHVDDDDAQNYRLRFVDE